MKSHGRTKNRRRTQRTRTSALARLKSITYPDTGLTSYTYGGACGQPTNTTIAMSGSSSFYETTTMDGVCRVTQTAITDPAGGGIHTTTTYDGMGRAWNTSNPYKTTSDPSYGLTTHFYDALGRVSDLGSNPSIIYPDGSSVSTTYFISGNTECTRVRDGALKTRDLCSDGLGRLTSVAEDPSGVNYTTNYRYNALNDLTCVLQGGTPNPSSCASTGGQTRSFSYDYLSRLLTATNPESGQISYTYDGNSNVASKTDARGLTTTYGYDGLNRLLYKNYSDTSTVRACYAYDGLNGWGDTMTNAVGHLTSSWGMQHDGTIVAANETYQFDTMGRPQLGRQCTPATCGASSYPISATYDLMGHELSLTESSVTRTSTYDGAARLLSFAATLPGPVNQNLLTNPTYGAVGLLTATLGNGLTETRTYNNRTWLNSLTVGSVYAVALGYSVGGSGNVVNGNVITANDSVNGNWSYTYDGVNRLQTATVPSVASFSYSYDRYGNMSCVQNITGGQPCTPALTFNAATNRITGYTYDASGNLLSDGTHQYHYDAENRIDCVGTDLNGNCLTTSVYYYYDAQGQRVGKQQGNTLEDYVYDPEGHIISVHDGLTNLLRAELYVGGRHVATWNPSANYGPLFWNHADWLGTERVRTDSTGTSRESCTDTPFGMNLNCVNNPVSPTVDFNPMHFTGKQHDPESGLDNFGARYYGSSNALGRFMSVDPTRLSAFIDDPQTWNRYSYAHNNPLAYVDRNGKWPTKIHNEIIDAAFPGLTANQLRILKDVSAAQDNPMTGGQSNALAFQHAMRRPGQSVEEAEADFNTFVSMHENEATKTQIEFWLAGNPGYSDRALAEFAAALHAVLDSTSPAHAGFQLWNWRNPGLFRKHTQAEKSINSQQRQSAVSAARAAFAQTFSMYNAFYRLELLTWTPPLQEVVTTRLIY